MGPVSEGRGILSFEFGAEDQVESIYYKMTIILSMNGREVFKFAVRQMGESALNVIEKAGLTEKM